MRAMKGGGDVAAGLFDLKLKRLAFVASSERALVPLFRQRKSFAPQSHACLLLHFAKDGFEFSFSISRGFDHDSATLLLNYIGNQNSDR